MQKVIVTLSFFGRYIVDIIKNKNKNKKKKKNKYSEKKEDIYLAVPFMPFFIPINKKENVEVE